MLFSNRYGLLAIVAATFVLSACHGSGTLPTAGQPAQSTFSSGATPADTTSILKLLKKDVTIGSTVDATNGDEGPRAIAVVRASYDKLKKGQVLVCNFEDSKGTAGNGTTIEQFNPTPSSKPTTFYQSTLIKGCDGVSVTSTGDQVYAGGLTSKLLVWVNQNGKEKGKYGAPVTDPIGTGDAAPLYDYSPEYIYVGNADTGTIDHLSLGSYGSGPPLEVIKGFDVSKGSGWGALGPSGFGYWCGGIKSNGLCKEPTKDDTLFVGDGACNAVVQIDHASSLLVKDEIVVKPGCKTYTCVHKSATCAKLVKAGSPLDKPIALTVLSNGNMIVANSGNNTLVELTPSGQVLATKTVDTSKTPGITGLMAIGSTDATTALFYTDTNTNTLQELEQ